MSIIFVEYRILESRREQFLQLMNEVKQSNSHVELYEGTDQPGLFVEVWHNMTSEAYRSWKADRLSSSVPLWQDIHACVDGGVERVHIWQFARVI